MSETLNAQDIAKKLQEQLTSLSATVDTHEVSTVDEVGDGIARVSDLKSAMAGRLLEFKSSDTGETVFGLAQNLDRDEVGAVLFGAVDSIKEGDECRTTGRIMDIPVSRAMLGRVVNPLGQPIDGLGDIERIVAPHRVQGPRCHRRTPVCEPVQTGLLAIDSMVPIGRGQRELIIGDRKTGKTAIAIDAILNQRGKGMVCIYVAIGQKASTVANIRETLRSARCARLHHHRFGHRCRFRPYAVHRAYGRCRYRRVLYVQRRGRQACQRDQPRQRSRARHLRRPVQAGRGLPSNVADAASSARTQAYLGDIFPALVCSSVPSRCPRRTVTAP